jgi:hypothetical protein
MARTFIPRDTCPVCKSSVATQFKDSPNPEFRCRVFRYHERKGQACDGSYTRATNHTPDQKG